MNRSGEQNLILVGRVLRAHGVHGELKVIPETDHPDRFVDLDQVFLGKNNQTAQPRSIRSIRFQHTRKGILVLLNLEGIEGRDVADAHRKFGVYADRDALPPLEDNEFYWHDLVGCSVIGDGEEVGVLKEVLEMPAQHILVVARDRGPDIMVPAVDAFIEDIDVASRKIVIRPIDGLFDV